MYMLWKGNKVADQVCARVNTVTAVHCHGPHILSWITEHTVGAGLQPIGAANETQGQSN